MCCHDFNRREFFGLTTGLVAAAGFAGASALGAAEADWPADLWDPDRPLATPGKPLTVQPILMYRVSQRREAASWKSWGGVQSQEAAAAEADRIAKELTALAATAGFPLDILPVAQVTTPEQAAQARAGSKDVVIVYPASGAGNILRACLGQANDTIVFVRHRSGPVYYWYEALSVRYLHTGEQRAAAGETSAVGVDDVVVDDQQELLWRLRAFYGVKNVVGAKVLALGGASGKYDARAPQNARERYKLEIVEVSYADLGRRIASATANSGLMARAAQWADRYLVLPHTTLATDKQFVVNAFLLYGIFKDLMRETGTTIFTINTCMSTILPMSKTTACLALSLINDEGWLAFCESDFVIIPPGILLRHISGKPVFLHNSTFPHQGLVTCAHCTGPRRMDGARYEPAKILTHFESEYGAAPKIDMPPGQLLTSIDPEYSTGRWVGLKSTVESNPFYEICRSQQDVQIQGDWRRLLREIRDSHWVTAYGDYLREVGYAARRIGVRWEGISQTEPLA